MATVERGQYRAIPSVLLDGKDFRSLSERARWVFVALKLNLGPAGIEVHYRRALAEQLAEQTGAPADGVAAALDELEAGGWVEREENIIWVVRHLEFEPNMKPSDSKHRKSIQRHISGLPHLPIVARFVAAYPQWFPRERAEIPAGQDGALDNAESAALKGLAWAFEAPPKGPKKAPRTTEDRRPKTENRVSSGAGAAGGWSRKAVDAWTARYGGTAPAGRIGKALKPLVDLYGEAEVLHVWGIYLNGKDVEYANPQDFAQKYGPWRDQKAKQQNGRGTPQQYDYSNATIEFEGFTA
jgi:hypothetical protein